MLRDVTYDATQLKSLFTLKITSALLQYHFDVTLRLLGKLIPCLGNDIAKPAPQIGI